ncbi:hypothetical protein [Nocardia cyriacigeorgica]|uniref:Uncharacterized protein n=1 Tax=Nocardia cyriacigeorgica TaxID=135487 RepID=A0A6P1DAM1_9NOCA|nr:hypothetical protein [Nocardia cyriacigeorgica]NEW47775.1 hypothetical protein [Nocardia cyriacigeorgica]
MAGERNGFLLLGGVASIGAGALHLFAAGLHTEHTTLARLMVVLAAAQCAAGLLASLSARKAMPVMVIGVNLIAVGIWGYTRFAGLPWPDGLGAAEAPQFLDSACAALGVLAIAGVTIALVRPGASLPMASTATAAGLAGVLAVAAMLGGAGHVHSHGDGGDHTHAAAGGDHSHGGDDHSHGGDDHGTGDAWPRPWDPATPIDVSGVPGATPAQEQRATALIRSTLDQLPAFADVESIGALGFRSIGDSATGYEHYINTGYIRDDRFLDAAYPESLVYRVDGTERTLVSAMYIAKDKEIDDPELADYGGPLMQWHVHDNLCWTRGDNGPVVAGVTDAEGNCPPNSVNPGAGNPMVHVWITAHQCGPFAALEGHGAGQAASAPGGRRTDTCAHDHSGGHR